MPPDGGASCLFSGGGSFEAGCAAGEGVGAGSASLVEPSGDSVVVPLRFTCLGGPTHHTVTMVITAECIGS